MAVHHVVLLKFKTGTTNEETAPGLAALAALPKAVSCIDSYKLGVDLGMSGGNWDLCILARFETAERYREYADSEAHVTAVALLKPFLERRAAIQTLAYECSALAHAKTLLGDNVLKLQGASLLLGAALATALCLARRPR